MKVRILRWKRTAFAVLLTLLLSVAGVTNATAQSFTVGDLNYSINDDGTTVTLVGHVDGISGELVIPESVELYGTSYPVTRIGDYAFQFCSDLAGDLVIPNSVTSIGNHAFHGCSGFTGSLTIPNSVSSIGSFAFCACYGFTDSLTIGNSLTDTGEGVFSYCSGFTTLYYNAVSCNGLMHIYYASNGSINISYQGLSYSFSYYDDFWLYGCNSLTTLYIGENVQVLPNCFLYNCSNFIGNLVIPESVSLIGRNAFDGCTGFTGSLSLGNSVTMIDQDAFNGCTGFTGSLNIPNTVTTIGNSTFNSCSGFNSLTIGNSVTIIGENAFNGCSGITGSLIIPNAVTNIGNSAFMNCSSFSGTLTLGQSLAEIGNSAFFGACENFTAFNVLPETPPTLGANVFLSVNTDIPVYVPCGTLNAYQNADGWSSFTNFQEPDPCIWSITATANPTEGGTVSGGGTFEQGQTCTLTATPLGEYEFGNWTENGAVVSTDAEYTFTVESSRNLVANFTNPNFIVFADPTVEARCVELWDTNGDGHLSYDEAAVVTDLNWAFQYWSNITSFNELQYFTGLTYIHEYEFYDCYNLASIILPASVTSIGRYAFEYCYNFTSITIPESVTFIDYNVFYDSGLTTLNYNATNCSVNNWLCGCSLTNLTIGDNVQVIPDNFVSGQSNLVGELVIPASVTSIGNSAFANCSGFTGTLTLPASLTSIGGSAFANCSGFTGTLTLPASLTSIGGSAFTNCSGFTGTLTLPATLTSIESSAFANCTGFTGTLTIPESVTSIGNRAFANTGFTTMNYNAISCNNLGGEDYDENWNWVWISAFMNCQSMTTMNIGNNVQTIPYRAFEGISSLTGSLTIPASVTSIGARAFANTGFTTVNFNATNCTYMGDDFNNPVFADCSNLTTLNISENVEIIPACAFAYCSNLTGSLTIPNSVTSIERHAFKGCTGLNGNLSLSNTLTWIGSNAFQQCNFIGELTIPNTVEYIGVGAFLDCLGFTGTLTIGTGVTKIGVSAFRRCTGITTVQYNAINWQVDMYSENEFDGSWYYGDYFVSHPVFNECSNLSTIIIGEQVENIPPCAFLKCSTVTGELTIPSSVQSIGIYAFGMMGISTVNFNATNCADFGWEGWWDDDAGVYYDGSAFLQCNNLGTVNFGNNVQRIPANAFNGYSSLTGALVIPSSVMEIGYRAFSGCSGLTGALTLPNAVTSIGSYAFNGCGGLTGLLVIPNSVSYIGEYAFNGCNGLEGTLTIGNSVSEIGSYAFNNTALTTLNYQAANCTSIGRYDWDGNASVFYNFTTVDFGDNVESIPNGAFYDCVNLSGNLVLPNSLAHIGDQAFYNCYGFEGIVMGNSVETIGSEAFRNCGGLKGELTLPETLQSVGPSAFAGCNEISTVNYNAVNCQTMGNASQNVFADCLSLAHIRIGADVESIPNYAFKPCFLVTDMSVAAEVPPTIYSSTFGTVSRNIPVSVPMGSGEAYRTAPYWEEFFHITEDYSPNSYTYHWNVNVHQFASNMTVTGIIQIEGVEQTVPSLEIGAFCNGECRGRQLLTYYPQVDRYLVFLMLYGEDGDVFTFRLYDHEAGEELTAGCASVITFETDAIVGSFLDPYVFNFTDMQLTQFSEGWNWWSTYVEQGGIDGLSLLQESLGDNGVAIRSQASGYTDYYAGYGWYGSLESINNESSYRVVTSAPCVAAMPGNVAIPSQHPITLSQGWTWIGYLPSRAMDINTALEGLEATQGDMVKSQQGYSDYYPGYGWFGSLNTVEPGMGLMYYSTNGETVTFTYPDNTRSGELKQNLTAENNHWKPNTFAYPDNMTVMAVVELDDAELSSDNYELAAFANGECRGSVKLTYAEPLRRHVAFLTISGKDAAELSFRLYDRETGMEYYDAEESLDFVANAIVGDADDLYIIHFRGTTGMDELASRVQVYPNPVNAGERFSIDVADDVKNPVRVEIVNALGVETLRATSVQTPAQLTAPATAGVFTLRITVEGKGTVVRKLVVK